MVDTQKRIEHGASPAGDSTAVVRVRASVWDGVWVRVRARVGLGLKSGFL